MHSTRNAILALTVVGGYFAWRNRFAIQRQLESLGIKTPVIRDNLVDAAKSIGAKVAGKTEHVESSVNNPMNQKFGT